MSDAFSQFEERLEKLERNHRGFSNGYVASINPDGLIKVMPKEKPKFVPLRVFLIVTTAVILMKSVALSAVDQLTYQDRIAALAQGSWFEKGCALVMQADPVSQFLSHIWIGLIG
ncbi:MAG: hypothetical protein ABJQ70_15225 [Roseobacter sp.]